MGKNLVTIRLAAEILDVSIATLRHWDAKGKLKAERHPHNGYRLYRIGRLERFAEANNLRRRGRQKVNLAGYPPAKLRR